MSYYLEGRNNDLVQKLSIAIIVLVMFLVSGLGTAGGTNPWDELGWQDFPGEVPAREGYNFKGGTIPERHLDIVGSSDRWPGRVAVTEDYVYFELRVLGLPSSGFWTAVFFSPGATKPQQGNFNKAKLLVGVQKTKEIVRVVIAEKGSGQNITYLPHP